ncbi:MAG: sigma-70 family RNA polymerase sigma factor [Phycisphaerales bacterium]|nr:sigma-70 family RNA polymerase sigma factor [Phycisphaerales bacterium]
MINRRLLTKSLPPEEATAFAELYERYAPLVRSLAYDKLKDSHGAWDVVHDVFLSLLNGSRHGRGRKKEVTQAWIVAVARNKIVDRLRDRNRRRERGRIDETTPDESHGDAEKRQLDQLHAAIANLPENERLMVWLFYLDGIPALRIAKITNVPLRTVYARLAQARRSLRLEMSATGKETCS